MSRTTVVACMIAVEALELRAHVHAQARIQVRQGLVEEKDTRPGASMRASARAAADRRSSPADNALPFPNLQIVQNGAYAAS